MNDVNKIKIVILAAGKGKRMETTLPKVLVPLKGEHMIKHLLESVKKVYKEKPIVVVGYKAELVKKELGDSCVYVHQEEQLGSGHAVNCARSACSGAENIMVLYGDQPFISPETIKNLIDKKEKTDAKIILTTTVVPNFDDWYKSFLGFGRILRKDNEILGIKEYKDATTEEKEIKEVNAGSCIYNASWLWQNLEKIKNNNVQNEYYLTDLISIAKNENEKIDAIMIKPQEALGANTKEELETLEKFVL